MLYIVLAFKLEIAMNKIGVQKYTPLGEIKLFDYAERSGIARQYYSADAGQVEVFEGIMDDPSGRLAAITLSPIFGQYVIADFDFERPFQRLQQDRAD